MANEQTKKKITLTDLSKFIKQTGFVIEAMEDDSSENVKLVKLTLAQEVSAVGSNPTDQGMDMKLKGKTVIVQGALDGSEPESDFNKMLEGCEEKNGALHYSGPLKLDVSKPKVRFVNGEPTVTQAPRLWLVSVSFSKRGGGLRQQQRKGLSDVLTQFFGAPKQEEETKEPAKRALEPAEKTGG